MSDFIITALGNIVNTSGGASPVLRGSSVVHGDVTETFASPAAAKVYLENHKALLLANSLATDLRSPVITSVSPNVFNAGTSNVTIKGSGFAAATVGKLHVEDAAGGLDGNGYFLNCTFVDAFTLTAVPGGNGDGILPAGAALVYYEDSNSVLSNALPATADANQNVTLNAAPVATALALNTYLASPSGSDGNPVNANINGSSVKITGTGFAPGQRGALVSADGAITVPVRYLGAGAILAQMPPTPAGSVTFGYQYKNGAGQSVVLASAVVITFS